MVAAISLGSRPAARAAFVRAAVTCFSGETIVGDELAEVESGPVEGVVAGLLGGGGDGGALAGDSGFGVGAGGAGCWGRGGDPFGVRGCGLGVEEILDPGRERGGGSRVQDRVRAGGVRLPRGMM